MNRIPLKLRKYIDIVATNVNEIKSDYIFSSKKSVVNFVLGQSLERIYKISTNSSDERMELREIGKRFSYKYLFLVHLHSMTLTFLFFFVYLKCKKKKNRMYPSYFLTNF